MSHSTNESHWGKQRRMRARGKVAIRRRDRKRLGKPDEESSVIEPLERRKNYATLK